MNPNRVQRTVINWDRKARYCMDRPVESAILVEAAATGRGSSTWTYPEAIALCELVESSDLTLGELAKRLVEKGVAA